MASGDGAGAQVRRAKLPDGHRPITLKWVFKLKKDELGSVIKHKARLVARGFVPQEGIDYDDAFAPMVRMESAHVLLMLVAQEGWQVHHMDVKSPSSMATSRRRST